MNIKETIQSAVRPACMIALASLLAAGCGKAVEKAAETAIEANIPGGANVDIDAEGGNISIQGPDGSINMQTGDSVALPADFPADIPVPAGVTWHMVQQMEAEGAANVTVQGSVESPLGDVAAAIKEKASAEGWESISAFQQAGEGEMLTYSKGERNLHVSVTKDGEKTSVLISSQ